MNDHEPPNSLDKLTPGDDHANIPTRVTRLEVLVEEVIRRLDRLEAKIDQVEHKIDDGFEALNARFYYLLTALIAGLLGLLGKVIGVI